MRLVIAISSYHLVGCSISLCHAKLSVCLLSNFVDVITPMKIFLHDDAWVIFVHVSVNVLS